ncbi:30S ribosomal protein S6 [Candidatus Shapirobacteria bacterium RIFOXYD1_FULL_38_32]|jgi:ribosomal protein S6|uniref:Small ribosomal subunit protein bS6 n=3 Tax=Patescibacteria group TaxID=1783273 RepID=A0A0G0M3V3_9BACT|nr:MAG: 30S ribosomal protein S6 [Candidatus Shapirobacteria bacterium GW2011_GWE2_38_30]KKQ90222.1 MAG: 30S ribosomal protein S6 [Candidatus Shapirobacteria bacterium GW2011_GWE1_38_92]OGJ06469.1 MAG: 30S ribosomal protein S6 [Candidatus Nomurabacteria bacterium RIFOXYA1_FULL_35_17]OGL57718.1 MAG: 30S ribosomal protein S6 [Candidatus Shapirobacteria bacterium RIFOXYC1_FULL_38_24]OGL58030.1 MAG: 30S ribosomal protein S6 [Candidatus Shapirobacteria bacterium RIFOXYD1_FULL_38_32]HAP37341.1 30S r
MKENKIKYQIVVVLDPKVEKKEVFIDKIGDFIDGMGAKVAKKENLGTKELAYEIKENNKADFWILNVESEKNLKFNDFNVFLNREVNVIRYLILK